VYDQDRYFTPKQHSLDDNALPQPKLEEGYYATKAIAQHAIELLAEHQINHREKPFFLYLAFTAPHFPIQALPEDIEVYNERYKAGWDVLRKERYARMKKMGLVNCPFHELAASDLVPHWNNPEAKLQQEIGPGEVAHLRPWKDLTKEQQRFQATKMAVYAGMIHRMDIEIGHVLEQLKKMGAMENTVIFFLSDNGGSADQLIRGDRHDPTAAPGSAKSFLCLGPPWGTAANTPFRMHKSWVHEGGISTPLIVHWPKGISVRGELRHTSGHIIDLAPTIIELAGGKWSPTDTNAPVPPPGKSLVPAFGRDRAIAHDYFWWYHDGNRAMRIGNWKLVADHDKPWELYDLTSDRSEAKNLAADQPKKMKELSAAWEKHREEFSRQAWPESALKERTSSK
jgi:arylsulfatase A-like enzyme